MAWKAKTLAKALITFALEITFGLFSAIAHRFGYMPRKTLPSLCASSENGAPPAFLAF